MKNPFQMQALSIRPPWSWLILKGKDIENRTWPTNYRGRFYIHSSLTFDMSALPYVHELGKKHRKYAHLYAEMCDYYDIKTVRGRLTATAGHFGGIIGSVELVDCIAEHKSPWWMGPVGFLLRKPAELTFIPITGKLGFFDVFKKQG